MGLYGWESPQRLLRLPFPIGDAPIRQPAKSRRLIKKDVHNKDVLFPYLNGEDLNSRPDQSPI